MRSLFLALFFFFSDVTHVTETPFRGQDSEDSGSTSPVSGVGIRRRGERGLVRACNAGSYVGNSQMESCNAADACESSLTQQVNAFTAWEHFNRILQDVVRVRGEYSDNGGSRRVRSATDLCFAGSVWVSVLGLGLSGGNGGLSLAGKIAARDVRLSEAEKGWGCNALRHSQRRSKPPQCSPRVPCWVWGAPACRVCAAGDSRGATWRLCPPSP